MSENKIKNQKSKIKITNKNLKILNFGLSFCILIFAFCIFSFSQEEFVYDAKGKRNPFIALVTADGRLLKLDKEETRGDLLIEGVIYDKYGRSYAIVNGAVVGIGDMAGDYQVLKIEEKKVIFIKEGKAMEVEMHKEEEEK